jgi:Outer membrane efflux protein
LLLSFANRTIYNLGSDPSTSISTISFDFIQPLLRGAGRAVALEPLTQAERNLLYAIRDYVKFQQEFYVFIAAGQPSFIPGVQAGVAAITSGTVTLPGRFTPGPVLLPVPLAGVGVSAQVVPGSGGTLVPINGAVSTPQGFISAILEKEQLVNQFRNIQALRRFFDLFGVYLEGGIVNKVQVGQVEQQLLSSIQSSLSQQYNYRISIDQFKQQLGLPMCVPLELDDEPLRAMIQQSRRFEDVYTDYDQVVRLALRYALPADVDKLRSRLRRLLTESAFVRGTGLSKRVVGRLDEWAGIPPGPGGLAPNPIDRKIDVLAREREALRRKQEKAREVEKGDLTPSELSRLQELDFEIEVGQMERALRIYVRKPWVAQKDEAAEARMRNNLFIIVNRHFLGVLDYALGERVDRVRKQWPDLPALCVNGVDLLVEDDDKVIAAVSQSSLENRLDLMNQRAQRVDSWRKIKVAANALLGVVNVEYHYDLSTPAGVRQPFNFGGSRGRSQFILNSELPLVRIQQRNDYRSAIITYQQQRRQLQLAEDNILFSIRLDLRQLRAAATSYHKVQKRSIELAYLQVDQALQAFSQPQPPTGPAPPVGSVGPPTTGGGTGDPAALTQQLLTTQNSLLQAQNGLYNAWINYITTRMSLYRDLGLMPLDPRVVWIDDIATCHCPAAPVPERPARPDELPEPRALPAPEGKH